MAKNEVNLCEGSVLRGVAKVAVPTFLLSMVQLSYSIADQIMAGRFAGAEALAAVGSVGGVTSLLVSIAAGLSMGSGIVMGRAYGSGNEEKISDVAHTSVVLSLLCGFIMLFSGVAFMEPMLNVAKVPDDIRSLARIYLFITYLAFPFSMLYNFCAAVLRGVGDTKTPMYIGFVSGFLNVVLNFVFLIPLRMGVAGVSIASAISTVFSAIWLLCLLIKTDAPYKIRFKKLKIKKEELVVISQLGIPSGIQNTLHTIANFSVQVGINTFGAVVIAGCSAASNIDVLVWTFGSAVNTAATTFVSQNMGAGKNERVNGGINKILLITLLGGMFLSLLLCVFIKPLLSLYTTDPAVIQAGIIRNRTVGSIYFTCALSDVIIGILRAKGHAYFPTVVSFIFTCCLRVLWMYTVFAYFKTLESIYAVYLVSWLCTIAVNMIFLKKHKT